MLFIRIRISMVYVLNVIKVPNIRSISTKTSLSTYRCGSSGFLYQSAFYYHLSFYIIMMIGVHKNWEFSSTRIQSWMCLLSKLTKVFLHFFPKVLAHLMNFRNFSEHSFSNNTCMLYFKKSSNMPKKNLALNEERPCSICTFQ